MSEENQNEKDQEIARLREENERLRRDRNNERSRSTHLENEARRREADRGLFTGIEGWLW